MFFKQFYVKIANIEYFLSHLIKPLKCIFFYSKRTELERNYKVIGELETKVSLLQEKSDKKSTDSYNNSEQGTFSQTSPLVQTGKCFKKEL